VKRSKEGVNKTQWLLRSFSQTVWEGKGCGGRRDDGGEISLICGWRKEKNPADGVFGGRKA